MTDTRVRSGNGTCLRGPVAAVAFGHSEQDATTSYDDGSVLSTTDPGAWITRTTYDAAGRTTKVIRNYVDGTAGGGTNADEDQIIEYGFTKGLQTTYVARVPGGTDQDDPVHLRVHEGHEQVPGSSAIASGHLLRATVYPGQLERGTTRRTSTATRRMWAGRSLAYNTLGQVRSTGRIRPRT